MQIKEKTQKVLLYMTYGFPYLSFGLGDTSIITLLSILLTFTVLTIKNDFRIEKTALVWITLTIIISLYYALIKDWETFLRVIVYGVTIPACLTVFKEINPTSAANTFKVIRIIFLIFAAIQLSIGMELYSEIASMFFSVRYADGRGVTSVGPEPTAFAILYLMFTITAYHINKSTKNKHSLRILIIDLALAFSITLSSSLIFYLTITSILGIILSKNKSIFLFSAATVVAAALLITTNLPELRISTAILSITEINEFSIDTINLVDESILDRISQPIISIYFSINNYLLPTTPSNVIEKTQSLHEAFSYLSDERYERKFINSGIGELIIFYGLAFIIPIIYIYRLKNLTTTSFSTLIIIYIFSIPFGHPTFWATIAIVKSTFKTKAKETLQKSQ